MLTKLSLAANALLIVALAWMYVENRASEARTRDVMKLCADADETYIRLLADSLSALGPVTSEEAVKFKESVAPLVAGGLQNIELRKTMGLTD